MSTATWRFLFKHCHVIIEFSTIQIFQKHLSSTILEIELITKIHRRKPTGYVTESTKSNGEKNPLIFSGEGEEEEHRFSGLRPTAVVLRLVFPHFCFLFCKGLIFFHNFRSSPVHLFNFNSRRFARLYEIEGDYSSLTTNVFLLSLFRNHATGSSSPVEAICD
ncbi:hypothetical protein YC2023_098278 [Brassica napus]